MAVANKIKAKRKRKTAFAHTQFRNATLNIAIDLFIFFSVFFSVFRFSFSFFSELSKGLSHFRTNLRLYAEFSVRFYFVEKYSKYSSNRMYYIEKPKFGCFFSLHFIGWCKFAINYEYVYETIFGKFTELYTHEQCEANIRCVISNMNDPRKKTESMSLISVGVCVFFLSCYRSFNTSLVFYLLKCKTSESSA